MRVAKKLLSLLLCIAMLMQFGITVNAAGGETNLYADIEATEVEVGQEFYMDIYVSSMTASAIKAGFYFDNTKLEVVDIYWEILYSRAPGAKRDTPSTAVSATNMDQANETGTALGLYAFNNGVDSACKESAVVYVIFKAIAPGDARITLREETTGTDAFASDNINPVIITIGSSEPEHECTPGAVTYQQGTNGKHTKIVACADNCGENYSVTEEDCSGGTADCENAAVCEHCGNTYGEAKGHGKTNGFRYTHVAGSDTHDVICADCGKTVEAGVACTFEDGSHTCKYACGNSTDCADNNNDHYCDVCDTKLSECSEHLTKTNEVPATCSKDGVKAYWTCSCGKHYADDQAAQLIEDLNTWKTGDGKIAATGNHVYVPGEPVWSADYKTVTVTGECGCGEEVSATAETTGKVTTAGNCQTEEVTTYTATFTESWITNKTVTKVVVGEKNFNVHIGEQKTEYTDNGDTHTVTVTCECGGVISTETVGHLYGKDFECDCGHQLAGWQQKQGDWYYVVDGKPVTGAVRVPYPTVAINGVTYIPNADDLAYWEANQETSGYTDAETAVFVFGADGKFQQTTGIVDGTRYAVNGMIGWHVGLVEVDGEYYYFVGDVNGGGNIAANGDTYLTRINGIAGFTAKEVYNFENGKFSGLNGLVDRYGDGKLYYYENSKLMLGNGLTKFGEEYIYVRSNGQIAVGKYWVAKTNGICDPGMYTFGDDGFLQSAKDPNVNGLVDGVYYKDGMPYYAGLIEIDGDTYYINSAGEVVTGTYYVTKLDNYTGSLEVKRGDKLTFGADGKLVIE